MGKLTKRPASRSAADTAKLDSFVNGAPDALPAKPAKAKPQTATNKKKGTGLMRGNRLQITHTITVELHDELVAVAKDSSQTKAGAINSAIKEWVKNNR